MFDRGDLTQLAEAICDGAALDWPRLERLAATSAHQEMLACFQLVERIAVAHGSASWAAEQSPTSADSIEQRESGDHPPPETWGPLRLIERIGRGTFGDVYRAWDSRLDREVALKLVRVGRGPEPPIGDSEAAGFIDEARLMARVHHPGVVTVHGAERVDGRAGFWMELLRGRTLEQELAERGALPAEEVAAIGVALAEALAAVHAAGLVHRDVKAQNVMCEPDGRIVLMDFGTGLEAEPSREPTTLAGTPLYLAPEVLLGGAATASSDIYSLGVLLFHLATGAFPVHGRSIREVRLAHARGERARLRDRRPDFPPALGNAIERLISAAPADRAGTSEEAALMLLPWTPAERRRRRMRRRVRALAAVVVAIVLAAGGWWMRANSARAVLPLGADDWLLVGAIENRTGDPAFDRVVADSIERELSGSAINVVPENRTRDALRLIGREGDAPLDRQTALQVTARDPAIKAVIDGVIELRNGRSEVRIDLVRAADGVVVDAVRLSPGSPAEFERGIHEAANQLRAALGEFDRPQSARTQSMMLTTSSAEARGLYLQAEALMTPQVGTVIEGAHRNAAEVLLRRALTLDSEFATAHMLIAASMMTVPRTPERLQLVDWHAERAMALAARTSKFEQAYITGTIHHLRAFLAGSVPGEPHREQARAALEMATNLQRGHFRALMLLAEAYERTGRPGEAADAYMRLADLRPNSFAWQARAAFALARNGRRADAAKLARRGPALLTSADYRSDPGNAVWILLFPAHQAWLDDDPSAALKLTDEVEKQIGRLPETAHVQARFQLLCLYLTLGRLRQAEQMAQAMPSDDADLTTAAPFQSLAMVLFERGDLVRLRAWITQRPIEESRQVIGLYLELGLIDAARPVIEYLKQRNAYSANVAGHLALATGNTAAALPLLEGAIDEVPGTGLGYWRLVRNLSEARWKSGDKSGAVGVLEERLRSRHMTTLGWSVGYEWMRTQAMLAELYRKVDRSEDARAIEAKLLSLLVVAEPDHPLKARLSAIVRQGR